MHSKEQFLSQILEHEAGFSPSDRIIADYLIHSYPGGLLESTTALADKLGVSGATVSRFFPKIGFKSIRQAQEAARHHLEFLKNSPLDRYHQKDSASVMGDDLFDQTWEVDISNIQRTYQGLNREQIATFMDMVFANDVGIYILGERKAFVLAFYLYVQLNALRPNVVQLKTDQSLIADTAVKVKADDCLILFDFRRYLNVNYMLARAFKDVGGKVAVIGDSPISPSAKLADALFVVETNGVSIFDSYTSCLTLINALLTLITRRSGDYVRQRYENLERLYRQFDIFSNQEIKTNITRLSLVENSPDKTGGPESPVD